MWRGMEGGSLGIELICIIPWNPVCEMIVNARNNACSLAVTYRFFFCRYRPWSRLLHHMHAARTLHHSHETLHGSHKTLHFLHETILAQFSYEMVYMVWNTLKGFHSLCCCTVYCGLGVIWWYFIVPIPVHIELTIYSQIVNDAYAYMFTYCFKTNV